MRTRHVFPVPLILNNVQNKKFLPLSISGLLQLGWTVNTTAHHSSFHISAFASPKLAQCGKGGCQQKMPWCSRCKSGRALLAAAHHHLRKMSYQNFVFCASFYCWGSSKVGVFTDTKWSQFLCALPSKSLFLEAAFPFHHLVNIFRMFQKTGGLLIMDCTNKRIFD